MYFPFKPGGIQVFWVLTIFPAMIIIPFERKPQAYGILNDFEKFPLTESRKARKGGEPRW